MRNTLPLGHPDYVSPRHNVLHPPEHLFFAILALEHLYFAGGVAI